MVFAKRKSAEPFAGNFGPLGDATGGLNFAAHGRSPRPSRGRLLEDQEHLAILEQESITAVMAAAKSAAAMTAFGHEEQSRGLQDVRSDIRPGCLSLRRYAPWNLAAYVLFVNRYSALSCSLALKSAARHA